METWRLRRKLASIFRYEYWPFIVFFMPLIPIWLYYAIRNRSLVYFTAVNPGIFLSGLFGESKKDILINIDKEYLPITLYLEEGQEFESVKLLMLQSGLTYPVILKPDVGERGNEVEKIESDETLRLYLKKHTGNKLLMQEFVVYEHEFGVFYYKYPDGSGSGISSITGKKFLTIIGNGRSTMKELIQNNIRASMHYERLMVKYKSLVHQILPNGKEFLLEPIGNHCKGTMFLDKTALVNERLIKVFDGISSTFDGFYFGRYDLKVRSIEDLYSGKNIKVLEVNGVTSEPAHVYDPSYALWKAYRDIAKNMGICADIARMNNAKGVPYLKAKDVYVYLKSYFKAKDAIPTSQQSHSTVFSHDSH